MFRDVGVGVYIDTEDDVEDVDVALRGCLGLVYLAVAVACFETVDTGLRLVVGWGLFSRTVICRMHIPNQIYAKWGCEKCIPLG